MSFLSKLFGGGGDQTVTTQQTLPPEFSDALSWLLNQSQNLYNPGGHYSDGNYYTGGSSASNYINPTPYIANPFNPGVPYSPYYTPGTPYPGGGIPPAGGSPTGGTAIPGSPIFNPGYPDIQPRPGGAPPLVPGLSPDTLAGIDILRQGPPQALTDLLGQTSGGSFFGQNPYIGDPSGFSIPPPGPDQIAFNPNSQNGANVGTNPFATGDARASIAGVTDAIQAAASRAVQDRFSQAGRSGSPAEGINLAQTVTRELAPYAFSAEENALQRGFLGSESGLGRQFTGNQNALQRDFLGGQSDLQRNFLGQQAALDRGNQNYLFERTQQIPAAQMLYALQQATAQNRLSAGGVFENNQAALFGEPYQRLGLAAGPIVSAISGAPMTQTQTTQGGGGNDLLGILGLAATAASLFGTGGASAGAGGSIFGF